MTKIFFGFMIVLILICTGFLISTGFGEGIEYALGFFIAITVGSLLYDRIVRKDQL